MKKLENMSLEELWQLFPIILEEHNDDWNIWYEDERKILSSLLGNEIIRISHIGSTAINRIWAKPTVDIMIETESSETLVQVCSKLKEAGYLCMWQEKLRACLNKGYTPEGFAERVFHIHIRIIGDNDELYFRDYMNDQPDKAREYESLKKELWKKFEHDRDAYTDSKTSFVRKYTEEAKQLYGDRYGAVHKK